MKYLLLTLALFSLVGCEDPDINEGYDAGYDLTCGFSWSPGNRFVVDKEFAHQFLAGARACAREHPDRARKVLRLASEERAVSATGADKPIEPIMDARREQQEPLTPEPPRMEIVEAPLNAESPSQTKAHVQAETPVKAKARSKATPPTEKKTAVKAKAPAKTKTAVKTKTPVKASAPAKAKAPAKAAPPVETRTAPAKNTRASAPKPKDRTRPATTTPRQQTQRKKTTSSYESFMGE